MDKNQKSAKTTRITNTSTLVQEPEEKDDDNTNIVDDYELPNLIKQFITIQTNINDLKKQIKTQNIQYKLIQQKVIQFMNSKQLQNIDTQQNLISIRNTNVKQHINMALLSNFFNKKHGVPIETIENFLDQVPIKTQSTLIIKPK
jgi:hypothetical protein